MTGERLKRYMRANGLTNNDVAERLGMTAQNLSALLAKEDIKTGFMERFCEVVGLAPADLYGGTITALASDHSTAIAGAGNSDASLLAKALDENARLVEQNSRLLGIIEKLQQ